MQNLQDDNHLDDLSRRAADAFEPDHEVHSWEKLLPQLDAALPQKKERKRRFIIFFLLFLLVGGGLIFSAIWSGAPSAKKERAQNIDQPKSGEAKKPAIEPITIVTPGNTKEKSEQVKESISEESVTYQSKQSATVQTDNSATHQSKQPITIQAEKSAISQSKPKKSKSQQTKIDQAKIEESIADRSKADQHKTDQPATDQSKAEQLKADQLKSEEIKTDQEKTEQQKEEQAKIEQPKADQPKTEQPKTEQPTVSRSNKKAPQSSNKSKWEFGLTFAPDVSTVKFTHTQPPGINVGITIAYNLSKRLAIQTGVLYTAKNYKSYGKDYHPPKGYWTDYVKLESVTGECDMYDIPLNLRYNLAPRKSSNFFVSAGLSSYLMKKEDYDFFYYYNGNPVNRFRSYYTDNKHWFSVVNLSLGYEKQVGRHISLQAEPFFKQPLKGLGFGKVKLNTTGIYFTAKYRPFAGKKSIQH